MGLMSGKGIGASGSTLSLSVFVFVSAPAPEEAPEPPGLNLKSSRSGFSSLTACTLTPALTSFPGVPSSSASEVPFSKYFDAFSAGTTTPSTPVSDKCVDDASDGLESDGFSSSFFFSAVSSAFAPPVCCSGKPTMR